MKRNIITIDEKKCNGCGLCVSACHEGAIRLVNGKARLISESYCDGLGDCLPHCPTGAITIEERETAAYDELAVQAHLGQHRVQSQTDAPFANAATIAQTLQRPSQLSVSDLTPMVEAPSAASQLRQWPVQIKLVPVNAPFFHHADLLVAATCAGFASPRLHEDFIRGRITLIGCPKLDGVDYAEKLSQIFAANEINSVTVLRMEVPCCGGLTQAVKRAFAASGNMIPWQVITLSSEGRTIQP
ncbi:MAG: 4Fe-4S dicluster domain-containing protein [Anaerolineae bacterium]|nr:4Fe-4S dicluster domain-containing protein [Anaerolineae bacterium]